MEIVRRVASDRLEHVRKRVRERVRERVQRERPQATAKTVALPSSVHWPIVVIPRSVPRFARRAVLRGPKGPC